MENEINAPPLFPEFSSRMAKLTIPTEIMKLQSKPFRCFLKESSMEFPLEKYSEKSKKFFLVPFDRMLKKALQCKLVAEEVEWNKVHQRHSRPVEEKKNSDVSLAYRFGNMYLTKSRFTFGIMRTKPNMCHVYQISKTPLLFYLPKSSSYQYLEKTFKWEHRSEFDCFILEPDSTYKVGENMTYLIITTYDSLFAVDIRNISDLEPMDYKDPTEKPFKQCTEQRCESTLREDVAPNHSLQGTRKKQRCIQSAATTSQAFEGSDLENLLTANPSRCQPPDNNMTMSPVENSLEASVGEPTPKSKCGDKSATKRCETLKMSKKRKHEGNDEVNASRRRQSQQRQSSSEQGARPEVSRLSPSHRNSKLVKNRKLRKSSDRSTQTPSNTRRQNTTESANSSTLMETSSSEEDEPRSHVKRDCWGTEYEFRFIDMNWSENDRRPPNIMPYMTHIKGRVYAVVPIKI